jgi:hypothetical protein
MQDCSRVRIAFTLIERIDHKCLRTLNHIQIDEQTA